MAQPLEADINSTPSLVQVTAAAGGAGQALTVTPSSSIDLALGSFGGPVEYKVGAGAWTRLDRNEGVRLAIDLAGTAVLLRKATTNAASVPVQVTVNTVGQIKPTGGGPLSAAPIQVAASRPLTAADDGKTLECTATITLTVPEGLPAGFKCSVLPSGTTSIARSGTALINGAGTTLTRAAATNPLIWIVGRGSAANSYLVTGS